MRLIVGSLPPAHPLALETDSGVQRRVPPSESAFIHVGPLTEVAHGTVHAEGAMVQRSPHPAVRPHLLIVCANPRTDAPPHLRFLSGVVRYEPLEQRIRALVAVQRRIERGDKDIEHRVDGYTQEELLSSVRTLPLLKPGKLPPGNYDVAVIYEGWFSEEHGTRVPACPPTPVKARPVGAVAASG